MNKTKVIKIIKEKLKGEENINKILDLFPDRKFSMQDLEAIYDSLKQYEFAKNNKDVIGMYHNIITSIEEHNSKSLIEYINEISDTLDDKFFDKLKYKFPTIYKATLKHQDSLIHYVVYKCLMTDGENYQKYRNVLHFITDYYISSKREEYRSTYDVKQDLNLPFVYDKKGIKKYFVMGMLDHNSSINVDTDFIPLRSYVEKIIDLDKDLVNDCINYYLKGNDENISYKNDIKTVQKNMGKVLKVVNKVLDERYTYEDKVSFVEINNLTDNIKKTYYLEDEDYTDEILSNIDIDNLLNGLLQDDDCSKSLTNIMNKYKLHKLPSKLIEYIDVENFDFSINDIEKFITNYPQIYKKEKLKNLNFIDILINTEIVSENNKEYQTLLTEEDYRLIKRNANPNRARMDTSERIEQACKITIKNFKRTSITVPSFNEVLELSNGKKVRAIVGNFTDPSTVTHGERTESCMRIGGFGKSLFNFCLNNENGFHVVFRDAETNAYITRTSGFRNGNTVFFNQLRRSTNEEEYSNDEVIECCREASKLLIEKSKNSSMPIDNVVTSNEMAFEDYETVKLNVYDIREGLSYFYTDILNTAVIVATSDENNELVPINFDKDDVPTYETARNLVREGTELEEQINRVHAVKQKLDGIDNTEESIKIIEKDNIDYAVCNDDWYIYVDKDGKVHSEIIDIDYRAKEEFNTFYNEIISKLNNKSVKKLIKS